MYSFCFHCLFFVVVVVVVVVCFVLFSFLRPIPIRLSRELILCVGPLITITKDDLPMRLEISLSWSSKSFGPCSLNSAL